MPNGIASAYGGIEKANARLSRAANRIARYAAHSKRVDAREIIEMRRAKHAAKANARAARTAYETHGALFDRRV